MKNKRTPLTREQIREINHRHFTLKESYAKISQAMGISQYRLNHATGGSRHIQFGF